MTSFSKRNDWPEKCSVLKSSLSIQFFLSQNKSMSSMFLNSHKQHETYTMGHILKISD